MAREKIDVLIMTPLDEEMRCLVDVFGRPDRSAAAPVAHHVWRKKSIAGVASMVAVMQPDMDQTPAMTTVSRALERWEPRLFVLVGLGGSLSDDAALGDVVVAREIFHYDARRKVRDAQDDGTVSEFAPVATSFENAGIARAQLVATSSSLEDWCAECLADVATCFTNDLRSLSPTSGPRLHLGAMASGSAVVDSSTYKKTIKSANRKFMVIEMEAVGAVAAIGKSIPTIVVRGISDLAFEKNAEDKRIVRAWRRYAMRNAARTLRILLAVTPLPRATQRGSESFAPMGGIIVFGLAVAVTLLAILPQSQSHVQQGKTIVASGSRREDRIAPPVSIALGAANDVPSTTPVHATKAIVHSSTRPTLQGSARPSVETGSASSAEATPASAAAPPSAQHKGPNLCDMYGLCDQ